MRRHLLIIGLLTILMSACAKPKALIEADLDPNFQLKQTQGLKIYLALKDQTVEEKKFSFLLEEELKKMGFSLTASPELSDYHLMYALNLENYKTKEFIMLSNPEFISGTLDGRNFTAQRQAYRYEPIERAHVMKQIHLDLFVRNQNKLEKVWSGLLKIENEDYRKFTQSCIHALANAIGKDMSEKVTLQP
jgi:hypothetical protein